MGCSLPQSGFLGAMQVWAQLKSRKRETEGQNPAFLLPAQGEKEANGPPLIAPREDGTCHIAPDVPYGVPCAKWWWEKQPWQASSPSICLAGASSSWFPPETWLPCTLQAIWLYRTLLSALSQEPDLPPPTPSFLTRGTSCPACKGRLAPARVGRGFHPKQSRVLSGSGARNLPLHMCSPMTSGCPQPICLFPALCQLQG